MGVVVTPPPPFFFSIFNCHEEIRLILKTKLCSSQEMLCWCGSQQEIISQSVVGEFNSIQLLDLWEEELVGPKWRTLTQSSFYSHHVCTINRTELSLIPQISCVVTLKCIRQRLKSHKVRTIWTYPIQLFLFPLSLEMLWAATDQIQEWPQQQLLDFPIHFTISKEVLKVLALSNALSDIRT